jgi:hypothetical protein
LWIPARSLAHDDSSRSAASRAEQQPSLAFSRENQLPNVERLKGFSFIGLRNVNKNRNFLEARQSRSRPNELSGRRAETFFLLPLARSSLAGIAWKTKEMPERVRRCSQRERRKFLIQLHFVSLFMALSRARIMQDEGERKTFLQFEDWRRLRIVL